MSGSMKGEHRGAAKPVHYTKRPFGRPKGSKNKPKVSPEVLSIINTLVKPSQIGKRLDMYTKLNGETVRMPKDVMLGAMWQFERTANGYWLMLKENLEKADQAQTKEDREKHYTAAIEAETSWRMYLNMGVDVAFKAAPYLHPRLSAILMKNPDQSSPSDVLSNLLKDLDEAGRTPRYIDNQSEPPRSEEAA